jgi:hypothetical protein
MSYPIAGNDSYISVNDLSANLPFLNVSELASAQLSLTGFSIQNTPSEASNFSKMVYGNVAGNLASNQTTSGPYSVAFDSQYTFSSSPFVQLTPQSVTSGIAGNLSLSLDSVSATGFAYNVYNVSATDVVADDYRVQYFAIGSV